MKYLTLLAAILLSVSLVHGQNDSIATAKTSPEKQPDVTLKERINGKRKSLYISNKGVINYNVFFFLTSDDYVSSLKEGVALTIEPESELKVASLVLKDGKSDGDYKYTLKVTEVPYELDLKRDGRKFNPKINQDLKDKDIVISVGKNCDLCIDIKNLLKRSRVKFKQYNHQKDSTRIVKLIQTHKPYNTGKKFYAPVIKIDDSLYTEIKTPRDLILVIDSHLN